jgi:PAS domain S-box-containing protein
MFSWIVRTPKTVKIENCAVEGETLRANYENLFVTSHKTADKPRNSLSVSSDYLDAKSGTRFDPVPSLSPKSSDVVVFLRSAYPGRFSHNEPRPSPRKGAEQVNSVNPLLNEPEDKLKQRFIFALDFLPLAAVVTNADGQIIFANALAENLLGYSPSELIGLSSRTILPAPQIETASSTDESKTYKTLVAGEPEPTTLNLVVMRKDGGISLQS